jgi:hypothetical protein
MLISTALLKNKKVLMNDSVFQEKSPPLHDTLTSLELTSVGTDSLLGALVVSADDPVVPFKTNNK